MTTIAKSRAYTAARLALRDGVLVRPSECERCGKQCRLDAAHVDYARPLDIRWLCRSCHKTWDNQEPKPEPDLEHERPKRTPLHSMVQTRGFFMWHIARVTGVQPWTLSRIASGEQQAPPLLWDRIAAYLHCTPDDIRPDPARTEAEIAA